MYTKTHSTILLQRLELFFVLTAVIILSGAFISLIGIQNGYFDLTDGEDPKLRLIYSVVYILMVPPLLLRYKALYYVISHNLLLMGLISLTVLSVFWSDMPDITLRRTLALIATTLFGIYFGITFSLQQQLKILLVAFFIILIGSLILIFWQPEYGIMSGLDAGRWRGSFVNKNLFGRFLSLFIVLLLAHIFNKKQGRLFFGATILVILPCLIITESVTAWLVTLGMVGVLIIQRTALRINIRFMIPFFFLFLTLILGISIFVINNIEVLFNFLGRDMSLTGRTGLWQAAMKLVLERPWLGYGYSSFWYNRAGARSLMPLQFDWAPHSHNGFLDLALDLGLVGLVLYIIIFAGILVKSLKLSQLHASIEGSWPLLYFVFILLNNFTESLQLQSHSIYWVLFMASLSWLALNPTVNKALHTIPSYRAIYQPIHQT